MQDLEEADRRWLESRWQWLIDVFGHSVVKGCTQVVPEDQYFPSMCSLMKGSVSNTSDAYWALREDVAKAHLSDTCRYMRLDESKIDLEFFVDEQLASTVSDSPGAVGVYVPTADGRFRVGLNMADMGDDTHVIATLAHELAHVHLLGHRHLTEQMRDHEFVTDLLTVFMGFGIICSNSALRDCNFIVAGEQFSALNALGYFDLPMYGYALAMFARSRNENSPDWAYYLRKDVKQVFKAVMKSFELDGTPRWSDYDFNDEYFMQEGVRLATRRLGKDVSELAEELFQYAQAEGAGGQGQPMNEGGPDSKECLYYGAPVGDEQEDACEECLQSIHENTFELAQQRDEEGNQGSFVYYLVVSFVVVAIFTTIVYFIEQAMRES